MFLSRYGFNAKAIFELHSILKDELVYHKFMEEEKPKEEKAEEEEKKNEEEAKKEETLSTDLLKSVLESLKDNKLLENNKNASSLSKIA